MHGILRWVALTLFISFSSWVGAVEVGYVSGPWNNEEELIKKHATTAIESYTPPIVIGGVYLGGGRDRVFATTTVQYANHRTKWEGFESVHHIGYATIDVTHQTLPFARFGIGLRAVAIYSLNYDNELVSLSPTYLATEFYPVVVARVGYFGNNEAQGRRWAALQAGVELTYRLGSLSGSGFFSSSGSIALFVGYRIAHR